ncbi:hypothetical protein TARUN_6662 [Trichoderma arundinaceum]|uniref:Uncharacterized protein n=1 Tax=Trichoderma arundinaceum TaxID=490622 RepID=A0A395NHM9_TRIAR|nr:hypothetical protein TARUN_6662 [Trichoderma arundinaceum]
MHSSIQQGSRGPLKIWVPTVNYASSSVRAAQLDEFAGMECLSDAIYPGGLRMEPASSKKNLQQPASLLRSRVISIASLLGCLLWACCTATPAGLPAKADVIARNQLMAALRRRLWRWNQSTSKPTKALHTFVCEKLVGADRPPENLMISALPEDQQCRWPAPTFFQPRRSGFTCCVISLQPGSELRTPLMRGIDLGNAAGAWHWPEIGALCSVLHHRSYSIVLDEGFWRRPSHTEKKKSDYCSGESQRELPCLYEYLA